MSVLLIFIHLLVLFQLLSPQAYGDEARPAAAAEERLADTQRRIADQYKHLEEVLLRMAELNASADPRRAELLRKAVAESKERLIGAQFDRLVELLDQERLSRALEGNADLQRDLAGLLELLLSENRARLIASQKARIRGYLKELSRVIGEQKSLQGKTEGGLDIEQLAKGQGDLAQKAGSLAEEMKRGDAMGKPGGGDAGQEGGEAGKTGDQSGAQSGKDGGKSSGGQSGSESGASGGGAADAQSDGADGRAAGKVQTARDKMKEAEASLEKAKREGALAQQEEALRRLEEAKVELEKILRQLREEEMKRILASLQARFENMLKLEREVYKGTLLLDKTPPADRSHEHEIAAGRLAGKQSTIVLEADKTLVLLKEDGTAVAFPEAVAQMRSDMQEAAERLARGLVDAITQGIERDILAALEEMIEALRVEIEKLEEGKMQDPPPGAVQQDPALIERLAELKMIRALQMRVNRRTAEYAKLLDAEAARNVELREALRRLAEREARIHEVTRKLGQ